MLRLLLSLLLLLLCDCNVLRVWKCFSSLYVIFICNYLDIRIATCEQLTLYIYFFFFSLYLSLVFRCMHFSQASLNGFENPSFGVSHTFHTRFTHFGFYVMQYFLLIPIIILIFVRGAHNFLNRFSSYFFLSLTENHVTSEHKKKMYKNMKICQIKNIQLFFTLLSYKRINRK